MENPDQFDLNEAVRRWRAAFQASSALHAQDVDELECHLRDSVQTLCARGLSVEEAFLVAEQRLGQPPEIALEFGKINQGRVWMERSVWMLVGILLLSPISWCSYGVSTILQHHVFFWWKNAHWIGFVLTCADWMILVLGLCLLWWLSKGWPSSIIQFVRACLRRPLLPGLAIVLVNYGSFPLLSQLKRLTMPATIPDISPMGPILQSWAFAGWWGESLLWITALVYLANRQLRASRPILPRRVVRCLDELASPDRETARSLLSQGLSQEEAVFLAARRHQSQPAATSVSETHSDARMGKERALWMVAGILLWTRFLGDLTFIPDRIALRLAQHLPGFGHPIGFITVSLQWLLVAGMVTVLWRVIARHERFGARVAQFGVRWPALGIIGLLFLYGGLMGVGFLIDWALPMESGGSFSGNDIAATMAWTDQGRKCLQYALPVVLLFWLARRLKLQEVR